jgi:hypothetical protein
MCHFGACRRSSIGSKRPPDPIAFRSQAFCRMANEIQEWDLAAP